MLYGKVRIDIRNKKDRPICLFFFGGPTDLVLQFIERCMSLETFYIWELGSGALYSKMLLVRIIENNKVDAYFGSG